MTAQVWSHPVKRIALVEDHALVRAAVRDILNRADLEVVGEFPTGEAAVDSLPRLRPDVVLVDLDLPGLSGAALIRELAPRLPETMFIILTASHEERDLFEAVRSGARGYLSKDLDQTGLVRALSALERGEMPFSRRFVSILFERFVFSRSHDPGRPSGQLPELTERENEILAFLGDGLSDREIADALVISRRTVESHVTHILHKLGVSSRVEAAKIYKRRG
jgi:DNA-binding NarL/FixJ family response regulator